MENISWMIPMYPEVLASEPGKAPFAGPIRVVPSGTSFANFWVETEKNILYT